MKPLDAVLNRVIWDVDVSSLPVWKAWLNHVLRVLHAVANELIEGQLTQRAASLVYTTLLSLVPLLAVSFSVLKGFGVHNEIEPLLTNFLAPLGEEGQKITTNVIEFVENTGVKVLGGLGVLFLFFTAVSLIQKIESAFNYAWHTTQARSIGQRFSNYLSVITIGPVLMFIAMGLTATVMSTPVVRTIAAIEPFGTALELGTRLLPFLLVIVAFAFVYGFVPNTRVRPQAAFVGALVAGVSWQVTGRVFAVFVASSTKYTAIYSSFAILFLFMFWLYLSWLILLLGASIAFYVQHPEQLMAHRGEPTLSSRLKEKLALLLMTRIGRDHHEGREPWTLDGLARWLGLPADVVGTVVESLQTRGLLLETAADPCGYVPGRSPEAVRVKDVLDAVRSAEESPQLGAERLPRDSAVDGLIERIDGAISSSLRDQTLTDLGDADQ